MKKKIAKLTSLQKGNKAFQSHNYLLALEMYQEAAAESLDLRQFLEYNIFLCLKRTGLKDECRFSAERAIDLEDAGLQTPIMAIDSLFIGAGISKTGGKTYVATSRDPYFLFDQKLVDLMSAGFYEISILIEKEEPDSTSKLYIDYGDGFSESDTASFPNSDGPALRRLIYFKNRPLQLRFDPTDEKGIFKLEEFTITQPGPSRILREIILRLNKSEFVGNRTYPSTLMNLYSHYENSFLHGIGRHAKSYQEWIEKIEARSLPDARSIERAVQRADGEPTISIVVPTYNTNITHLRACIESVIRQSYPHWELCIADDNSSCKETLQIIHQYSAQDKRIKVVQRAQNGHICEASNSAIDLVTGEYIAFLDHDDMLTKHALFFISRHIAENKNALIIYSDEDKVNENGIRCDPHFKSDWNKDLLYSQNYICHLCVYKTELIKKVGGLRKGTEGSQDHDLLLRCLPHIRMNEIHHIPRILYHWRISAGSTALSFSEKNYTSSAGLKALKDYFAANGPIGLLVEDGDIPNSYKVIWPLPKLSPLVSIIIPTRDQKEMTEQAVTSILDKTNYPEYEILIIDNGSQKNETIDWFSTIQQLRPRVKVLRYDHPFNYSAINNFGVTHSNGSILALINNDIEVISPEWLTEMVRHAIRAEIGCVGAKLYYSNDTIQHAGVILGIGGVAGHSHKYFPRSHDGYFGRLRLTQNLSAVTAAALLVRKNVYQEVNGLDEVNLPVAFNDVDFCLRVMHAGYRNIWTPYAELYHHESVSRGIDDTPEKQKRFAREVEYMKMKWGKLLKADPCYNPNLSYRDEDFSIGLELAV